LKKVSLQERSPCSCHQKTSDTERGAVSPLTRRSVITREMRDVCMYMQANMHYQMRADVRGTKARAQTYGGKGLGLFRPLRKRDSRHIGDRRLGKAYLRLPRNTAQTNAEWYWRTSVHQLSCHCAGGWTYRIAVPLVSVCVLG
jgi:hypothetical protein